MFLIKRETSNNEAMFKYSVFPVLVMLWAFFDAVFNRFIPGDKYNPSAQKDQDDRESLPRVQLGMFEIVVFIMSLYFLKFRYNVGALLVISYIWIIYLLIIGVYHTVYTIAQPELTYTKKTFWESAVRICSAFFLIYSVRSINYKLYR